MLTLTQIQEQAYATAREKGWHDEPLVTMSCIAAVLGEPRPGDRVYVVNEGSDRGKFCGEHERPRDSVSVPGFLFGRSIPADGANPHTVQLRAIHHERVLAKHALMHTELTEAWDAHEDNDITLRLDTEHGNKPEGAIVEIADAVVRICDTTRALGLDLAAEVAQVIGNEAWLAFRLATPPNCETATFADWLDAIRRQIDRATESARVDDWELYTMQMSFAVLYCAALCNELSEDLGAAIEAKMAYNKTRPHRHGGKQA